ncbi:MAG: molybdenum cofactor biosynthesis protein MoaE [Alphaproteobacteria bacterium]|nr:molybdenum cofactor biosynthesis protein MoaE [Alphaproteobacteria bacterium]
MSTRIDIFEDDFDAGAEIAALKAQAGGAGAIATFTGYVRGEANLKALTLEHYPAMTAREIARHVAEAKRRWPLLGVRVIHRVGRLVPGAQIVFVAVASAHRAAAFDACAFIMDYLKVHAPFWKQEEYDDGVRWVDAKASDDDAAAKWKR